MIWLWIAGAVALLIAYLGALFLRGDIRKLVRALRWTVGLMLLGLGALLGARGQLMLAGLLAAGGASVLLRGRLGPIDFGAGMSSPNNASSVTSRYFTMHLQHETGTVSGTVREGHFSGRELADLSAEECWALLDEVGDDPDSLALLQSWLDANRSGWRDYFADQFGMNTDAGPEQEPGAPHREIEGIEEAYDILGLAPGATPEAIRSAHRKLMKKVHPDAGGSAFLAARINQAKDLLLKNVRSRT